MKIRKNGDVITLTENDLKKIVKKVLVTEAMASDDSITIASKSQSSDVGLGKQWDAGKQEDKLNGVISVYGTEFNNKGKKLRVYGDAKFNGTSQHFAGCKVSKVEKAVPPVAAGGSSKKVVWNIHYELTPSCKMGIFNSGGAEGKYQNGKAIGTLKLDTNGGNVDVPVVFKGTMRNLGGKSDI